MCHVQSHHGGAEGSTDSFLVIFKVRSGAINLWASDLTQKVEETHNFRICCQNVGLQSNESINSVLALSLIEQPHESTKACEFFIQHSTGRTLESGPDNMVLFKTPTLTSWQQASFAMHLSLIPKRITALTSFLDVDKIGSCYLYLDPEFSTQGIQITPLLSPETNMPVGKIQVEYLIVTNPIGHDVPACKPDWLFEQIGLDAGHRGAGSGRRTDLPEKLLENTIDSFNYAHRSGADMCELDVLITADGIPIVYHDFDVDAVTSHQSSNELGKLRVQVNQFTYKQLRHFKLLALHDGKGCPYTLNVPNQAGRNRPFPKLADVLDKVDKTCGLNIEVKWPQLLESGKSEAKKFREINDFVERIVKVVRKHAGRRRIVLQSFDPDMTILLRLKQTQFPVIFLTEGMTDRYERYADPRARSISNGICFAHGFDLAGIDIITDDYFENGKQLVALIKRHCLIARAWGDIEGSKEKLETLKGLGLQCITYDRVDLVKNRTQV